MPDYGMTPTERLQAMRDLGLTFADVLSHAQACWDEQDHAATLSWLEDACLMAQTA